MIRPATPADLAELPAIERSAGQAFLAVPGFEWMAQDDPIGLERHRELSAQGITLVACEGPAITGFVCCEPLGSSLYVVELSVRRELQGKGTGRALMAQLASAARSRGWERLVLTTFRDVAWNGPFYARIGFRELTGADLTEDLRTVLAEEVAAGIPGEQRCAMELRLR